MPDLVQVLSEVFGTGDIALFSATVHAVGTGVVSLDYNGGTFTDVPFIAGGFAPQAGPQTGDDCYVIGRRGWGLLVLGKPPSGPDRTVTAPLVDDWDPYALAVYNQATQQWTTAGTDALVLIPDRAGAPGKLAAAFLHTSDTSFTPDSPLGRVTVHLGVSTVAPGDDALAALAISNRLLSGQQIFEDWSWYGYPQVVADWNDYLVTAAYAAGVYLQSPQVAAAWLLAYYNDRSGSHLELGLHATPGPSGSLITLPGSGTMTVRLQAGQTADVALPLNWIGQLLNGSATGVYARPLDYVTTVSGPGTVRLTSL